MKDQLGLTLFEVLIGLTITAVAGFFIAGFLTSSGDVFLDQTIRVNQGLSSNQAKQEIAEVIKSSSGVVNQYPPVGTAQFITSDQVLVLKLPAISASGQVIDAVFDYVVVAKYPSNSKLLKKIIFPDDLSSRQAEDKVLSTSLESINLSFLDGNNNQVPPTQSVRVTFTINLSDDDGLKENDSSSTSTVNLKNL